VTRSTQLQHLILSKRYIRNLVEGKVKKGNEKDGQRCPGKRNPGEQGEWKFVGRTKRTPSKMHEKNLGGGK